LVLLPYVIASGGTDYVRDGLQETRVGWTLYLGFQQLWPSAPWYQSVRLRAWLRVWSDNFGEIASGDFPVQQYLSFRSLGLEFLNELGGVHP